MPPGAAPSSAGVAGRSTTSSSSAALCEDKELVTAAVQQDGWALQHACEELRQDKEVALAAVQSYGPALEHVRGGLNQDEEVVLSAVAQDPESLQFASDELRQGGFVAFVQQQLRAHTAMRLGGGRGGFFGEVAVNELIARYADVPCEARRGELRVVRDALAAAAV